MKYITYFAPYGDAWHIKQIDESKIQRHGITSFVYQGMIYNSPLYSTKEEAYRSIKTNKQIIFDE